MKSRLGLLAIWLLCLIAALVGLAWMLLAIIAGSPRAWTLAKAYDQVGNAATGGDEDECISSRAWRYRASPGWRQIRGLVDWVAAQAGDHNHCQRAWEAERQKAVATVVRQ